MIAQLFVLIIAMAFGFAPELGGYAGSLEAVLAHMAGPLVAVMATCSCFPSLLFARYINIVIGIALTLSPLIALHDNPTALIVQLVAGLWITAFSLLARPIHKTGGWRLDLRHDDVDIDWA